MFLALHLIKNQKTYNFLVIFFVVLFSLICAYKLPDLRFDYEFEAFFPNEDHELDLYNKYRQTFEHDNEFVLIALENNAGIFNKDFLLRVDSLTQELSQIKYTQKVTSPTNLKTLQLGGLVPVQTPVLHFDDESFYREDSIRIYQSPYLIGSFFPLNAKSVTIYIKNQDGLNKTRSDSLAADIENAVQKFKFDKTHHVGRIFAQNVYLQNLRKEFAVFLALSFIMVIVFLWFSFKSVYGVIVPVSIVLISILWTLGIMGFAGKSIDIMTVMLPTMIFIAGMSDVVHFFSKYYEELGKGLVHEKIYRLVLKEVGFPTFLTLVTTVVAFLSLLFSSIKPIREFGIYTAIGVVIAFILSYSLLPALLYFFRPKKKALVAAPASRAHSNIRKSFFWLFRNQKTIIIITAVLIILSVIGIFRIRVNNILLEDLSEKVQIKQDFIFFDENYSGVRPLEILLTAKDPGKNFRDYDVLKEVNKVDEFIKKEYGAGFLISPAQLVKNVYLNSIQDASAFPEKEDADEIISLFERNKKSREIKNIITPDGSTARISAKIRDMGSIAVEEHNLNLFEFIGSEIDTSLVKFEITGAAHLVDRNNADMVENMAKGFIFSFVIISLLTFFLHRSWRMVLVFIIPNIIPLLIIAGVMGLAGIEMKAATSLVFSIAFGIATDDTIHFISRLKIELGYGKNLMYAFKRTFFETGKPIVLTTFILTGGFMSLMLSDFQSTFYFGFLICITIVVALLADLFLLPVLLFLIYKKKKPRNK